MTKTGLLIAVERGFPVLGIAICVPALFVLFTAAWLLGTSRRQRLTNLILGGIFSVTAVLVVSLAFDPTPNSWADENFTWIIAGIAPITAVFGVITAACYRRTFGGKRVFQKNIKDEQFL